MGYSPTPQRSRRPVASYSAAHDLVKATKGSPSDHECVACGSQAQQWALLPFYPGTLVMGHGRNEGLAFNPDPAAYVAMDRVCHRRLDAQTRATWKAAA